MMTLISKCLYRFIKLNNTKLFFGKQVSRVLSLLHNRDTKNNKSQENAKFSTRHYHI